MYGNCFKQSKEGECASDIFVTYLQSQGIPHDKVDLGHI